MLQYFTYSINDLEVVKYRKLFSILISEELKDCYSFHMHWVFSHVVTTLQFSSASCQKEKKLSWRGIRYRLEYDVWSLRVKEHPQVMRNRAEHLWALPLCTQHHSVSYLHTTSLLLSSLSLFSCVFCYVSIYVCVNHCFSLLSLSSSQNPQPHCAPFLP